MSTEADAPIDGATTEVNEPINLDASTEAEKETETKPEGAAEPNKADEQPTDEDSGDDDEKPRKRPSRTDRLKDRIRELSDQLAFERSRKGSPAGEVTKAPQEVDFNGDYQAYERAQRAFETEQAVRRVLDESATNNRAAREQELRNAQVTLYRERVTEAKSAISDFEQVVNSASGIDVRDEVADLIRESEKGPYLAYHLAKNPDQLRGLNAMTPVQAARELGRLEARLSAPPPKKQTSAPAPISTVNGGAAQRPDLAKMSMDEYVAYRKKQGA